MNKKHHFLPVLLTLTMGLSFTPAVFAGESGSDSSYAIPGDSKTESPKPTAEPTAKPEDPSYALPGGLPTDSPDNEAETPSPTASALPTASAEPVQSDAEFMKSFSLTFYDNIKELTPTSESQTVTAVLTRVPGERIGEAQWYLNGNPVADHYSSSFPIKSGKITAFRLPVVFEKGMHEEGAAVALEIRLGSEVRRIEKHISYRNYTDEEYDTMDRDRVLGLVRPMEIPATLRRSTATYADKYLSGSNGTLSAGTNVIYVDHYSDSSAYLYLPDEDRFCWVPYYSVNVSSKNLVEDGDYTAEDKATFVNAKGYASNTDYLIWVNPIHQRVNLFIGKEGSWQLEKTMPCATGANQTPTPTGITTYSKYDNGWFNPTYYVKPVLYINPTRAIALHSILFYPDGRVQDGTLGRNVSHGCIRMAPEDINFLAEYVPIGTTVVVF